MSSQISENQSMQVEAIVSLLSYFDIFHHPLTVQDFQRLKGFSASTAKELLAFLVENEVCFEWNGYFGRTPEIENDALRRIAAEKNAEKYWAKVKKYSERIANFPFVRGVAISGSLSKGVMTEDSDIDFFIITEPNRLWVSRSLLILYKKVRLLNSRKYFCLNYFVDTDNLLIIDKNIFTAVEVAHLIPIYSEENIFEKFYSANDWVQDYLSSPAPISAYAQSHDPYFNLSTGITIGKAKNRKEQRLSGTLGDRLEKWTHKMTLKRWMKKFGHFGKDKFELTMRSTTGVSKHHPQDFQSKVLDAHTDRFQKSMEQLRQKKRAY